MIDNVVEQIIFIHGLGQTSSSWEKTLSYMPENIISSAVSLDLYSLCKGKEYTYDNLYRAFKDYCRNIKEPSNLCGISLGAIMALQYAIEFPDKVNSLVLIAPQYKIPRLLMKFQSLVFHFMPQSAFHDMGLSKTDVSVLTKSMLDLDFSSTIKKITSQPLIVCGKKDKANFKAANELAAIIPGAKLYFIEKAGHQVNEDTPEELAAVLKGYYQMNNAPQCCR